jgi:DNA repair photolyase
MRLAGGAAGQQGGGAEQRSEITQAASKVQLEFLPRLPASPLPLLDERQRGTRFIEWEVRSVLNSPATTGMGYWSINPYVGCEFGCTYCYARETHRYARERAVASGSPSPFTERGSRGEVSPYEAFEKEILVKAGVGDLLAKTLDPAKLEGSSLVIGTATDPYQPAERKFKLTQQILERLRGYRGLSIGIISKSPLVTRDLRLLQELSRIHEVTVNVSLATASASLARRLERRSPVPSARLRALKTLTQGGIHAGLLVAPILPGISDDRPGLADVFAAARDAGACYVHGSALRLDPVLAPRFIALVEREFPHLADRYHSHFQNRFYVTPEYQQALGKRLRSLQKEFGFPVGEDTRRRRQMEGRTPRAPRVREQTSLL